MLKQSHRKPTPTRLAALALLAGGLLLLAGCADEPPPPKPAVQPVKMLQLGTAGGAGAVWEYPGTIAAAQRAEMAFEVAGRITSLPVSEGQAVKRGALLARLDARDYQARLDGETAQLTAAKAEHERVRGLYVVDAASRQDLDVARRNMEVAEAAVRTARKAMEETALRAPFSGTVAKKLVDDFANVQAKQPVLLLEDASSLRVVVDIPERDAARVKIARTVEEMTERSRPTVSLSSLPGRSFPARFEEVSTTADPSTRTFATTLAFDPPDDVGIRPGMTAKVTFRPKEGVVVSGPSGHVVPVGAVLSDDGGRATVWVVDPETMAVQRRAVELGEMSGDQVLIESGLNDGELVAVSGVHQLRDGMAVRRYEN